ncbi:RagB/SusD family nutrient uptake outer membrane protein [Sphingobacterium tabacisoli]|uniref:RagB/SusD family nutrient uptake outer membrane protein n=1 Tax=Sphingobacterium tabacisoli TaxID=2044855 RepID=A0ABW5L171_9SPHI|nr:RagB/SusD family nutrient uptake outer membrane protein [Sphingobacterium tabacisoli]
MKKTIYTLLVTCSLLSSCNSFLDVKPVDRILETEVFKDQKSAQMALNGIYLRMAKPNLYGGKLTMQTLDILGQYYNIGAAHEHKLLFDYKYTDKTVQAEFESIWASAYANLLNINNFIENLQLADFSIDKNQKDIMLGEAIGLRAFHHLDMLRLFGPIMSQNPAVKAIPYVTSASSKTEELLPASSVIEHVLADITQAKQLLQSDPVRQVGVQDQSEVAIDNFFRMRNRRMNYYALIALQARAELYAGKKAEAYQSAHSILSKVDEFFKWTDPTTINSRPSSPDFIFSPEILFGVSNDQLYTQYDKMFNPALTAEKILVPSAAALEAIFEKNMNDYRSYAWVIPTIGNYSKVFVKFRDTQSKSASFRYLQPLMRKSELYLILLETATDEQEALGYLNTLRNNRGLSSVTTIANRQTAVDTEFRKEFYGEGQLFFYNKRLAKTSVPNPANNSSKSVPLGSYQVPLPLSETNNR